MGRLAMRGRPTGVASGCDAPGYLPSAGNQLASTAVPHPPPRSPRPLGGAVRLSAGQVPPRAHREGRGALPGLRRLHEGVCGHRLSTSAGCLRQRVRVTRRHHPLRGQELEVLTHGKRHIVVRSPDGLSMKLPRSWTDVDGTDCSGDSGGDAIFTVESLRELCVLLEALARRQSGKRSDCSEVSERPIR
jgi:hypothetical protein